MFLFYSHPISIFLERVERHGGVVVNPPDGLAQQVAHGEHGELREVALGCVRDGVGHDHLGEHPAAQSLHRRGAEDGVSGARVNLLRARVLPRRATSQSCL